MIPECYQRKVSAKEPIGHKNKDRDRNGLLTKHGRLGSAGSYRKLEKTRNRLFPRD